MKRISYIFLILSLRIFAQDGMVQNTVRPEIHGYLKYMDQFSFIDNTKDIASTSLLHNRLNFKWSPKNWLIRFEVRNRLFYGDHLKLDPQFMTNIGNDLGIVNLSKIWVDENGLGVLSNVDRALINYKNKRWDVSLGRQRINWGINMIWNPNDIFNSYNFLDFDYEERPGSDGVRIQYKWKGFSAIEFALKKGKEKEDLTSALLFRSNKKKYDYQFLAGVSRKDLLAGIGWAGNIINTGFKGEFTYFHPYTVLDTTGVLSGCVSADYSFKDGWYILVSGYLNSNGSDKLTGLNTQQFFNTSAKELLPFRYSAFVQLNKQINPLFTAGISNIYSPTNNTWIVVPNLLYSLAANCEISLIGQSFFAQINNVYRSMGNSIFLRLKLSF